MDNVASRPLTLVLIIGILLTLTLTGCGERSGGDGETHANLQITWGGPKNIAMLPIIAQQKGLFQKQGLSAKHAYLQTGKISLDSVVRGDIQFGVIVEATVAFAGFQNLAGIKIIAVNQEKLDDAVIARKDHGIVKPTDLMGKRLAVTYGTNSQMYAYRLLQANHIDPKTVKIVNLSPPAIVAALNNGEVDAGSVWQPFRHHLKQQLGDKATHFKNQGLYRGYALIAVNASWAQKNPKAVERFVKVLIDAEGYIRQHHDEAIQTLAREIDLAPDLLEQLWGEYVVAVSLPLKLSDVLAQEGHWIIGNVEGFQGKPLPDYSTFLDSAWLKRIDAARVQ